MPLRQRRIGQRVNGVRGCPGWHYGLFIRRADGNVQFDLFGPDGRQIEGLIADAARTTTTAKRMGGTLRGYQHVAREAIRAS